MVVRKLRKSIKMVARKLVERQMSAAMDKMGATECGEHAERS